MLLFSAFDAGRSTRCGRGNEMLEFCARATRRFRAGARNRTQPGMGGQSRGRRLGGRTWYSVVWSRLHSDADSSAVLMI